MNKVLVIVVTYNSAKWVDKCFGSLRESDCPVDVIAIDNASTDETVRLIQENYPEVCLVKNKTNLGFGAANNIGITNALKSGYDYVYLLNADAWVCKYTIGKMVAAFEAHPELGVLSPVQMASDTVSMDPNFRRKCGKRIARRRTDIVKVPFVMAAHWMISAACLRQVGAFSPAFQLYGEDNNYLDRVRWHKFKVAVLSSAGAIHDRDCRPNPKERKMKLKCNYALSMLIDPHGFWCFRKLRTSLFLFRVALQYRSSLVWNYSKELRAKYPELKEVRKRSRSDGAFLNI